MKFQMTKLVLMAFMLLCFSQPATLLAGEYVNSISQNLRYKEASFYAQHAEERGIEVGIINFEKDEQRRILGKKVSDYKTYDVAITNNSRFRVFVNAIDVLDPKHNNRNITSPDLDDAYDEIGVVGNGNKDNLRSSIVRANFLFKSLQSSVIEPGDTLQGILFVKDKNIDDRGILKVSIQNLARLAYLDIEVPFEE